CLVIGWILLNPCQLNSSPHAVVPLAPYASPTFDGESAPPTPPAEFTPGASDADGQSSLAEPTVTPQSLHTSYLNASDPSEDQAACANGLFWNPCVMSGLDGQARVEFDV